MAVPSSGPISLLKIAKELKTDDYYNTISTSTFLQYTADDISLTDMSTGADDFSTDPINTSNPSANRPDGSTPHAMSEFYSYDHDYLSPYIYLGWSRTVGSTAASNTLYTAPSWTTYNTDPVVDPEGTGTDTRWRRSGFDLSPYQGRKIRLIIGFNHGTASFKCDVCLSSWHIVDNTGETCKVLLYPGTSTQVYKAYHNATFRGVVMPDDRNNISPAQNNIMQDHRNSTQSNPLYLGTSTCSITTTTNCWDDFSNTYDANGVYETASQVNGEWNLNNSGNSSFPQTDSSNTGPTYQYGLIYNGVNGADWFYDSATSEQQIVTTGYIYYEASGQSSQKYAWMRTVIIDVPDDADQLKFNYCAYSDDQTNWYNSWLKIYVHLVE